MYNVYSNILSYSYCISDYEVLFFITYAASGIPLTWDCKIHCEACKMVDQAQSDVGKGLDKGHEKSREAAVC